MKNKNELIKILSIFVLSGIFGFIYETIFYRIDLGYFVKRGITFGPWIPIYGFGGIFIYLLNKNKKNAFAIFLYGSLISGILEFLTGYILFNYFNVRLWDYNVEILNYGNIGGYICLRSILFFGLSSIFLIKLIVPLVEDKILNNKYAHALSILGITFFIDFLFNVFII